MNLYVVLVGKLKGLHNEGCGEIHFARTLCYSDSAGGDAIGRAQRRWLPKPPSETLTVKQQCKWRAGKRRVSGGIEVVSDQSQDLNMALDIVETGTLFFPLYVSNLFILMTKILERTT